MNWDRIRGDWPLLKGKIKEKWGKLSDNEIDVIAGRHDQLVGRVQQHYGVARHEAVREVEEFARRLDAQGQVSGSGWSGGAGPTAGTHGSGGGTQDQRDSVGGFGSQSYGRSGGQEGMVGGTHGTGGGTKD